MRWRVWCRGVNALLNEESYIYDQMDGLVKIKQVLSATLRYTGGMIYDAVGQVKSQTNAKGCTRLRKYDELRRLSKEIDPILGETTRPMIRYVLDEPGAPWRWEYGDMVFSGASHQ